MGTRAATDETAIGSVGESTAARAKATASGMAGISQWMKRPMPSTVKTTRPSARVRMVQPSRKKPRLGLRQPSRKSRGGRKTRKKISGSSSTSKFGP